MSMSSSPPDKGHRTIAYVRDIGRRLERRAEPKRSSDLDLRQLRSLQRAYGNRAGPEVLGDSIMYWTVREPDRGRMFDMIGDELNSDARCMALAGAGTPNGVKRGRPRPCAPRLRPGPIFP
jgi:hypothetical protein